MIQAVPKASTLRGLRSLGLRALAATGLPLLALRRKLNQGTIVLYHGVTREESGGIFNYRGKFVRTDSFAEHIEWLKQHFTILSLTTLVETLGQTYDKPSLAITFDDGYANNYTDAFPILRDTGIPATFFVTTRFIEDMPLAVDRLEYALGATKEKIALALPSGPKTFSLTTLAERIAADEMVRPILKRFSSAQSEEFFKTLIAETGRDLTPILHTSPYSPMTWDQMREMHADGMTFAAHTVTHPILSTLSREESYKEITESHEMLTRHNLSPLPIFAYPNGGQHDFSNETIAVLRDLGFTASLTTRPGNCTPAHDRFRLPRYTLDGANELYRAQVIACGLQSALLRLCG